MLAMRLGTSHERSRRRFTMMMTAAGVAHMARRIGRTCLRPRQGRIVVPGLARPGAMPDNRALDPGIRTYL